MTAAVLDGLKVLATEHAAGVPCELLPMPGGASLRRFFRVRYASGASAVGMFFPDAARAEEVGSGSAGVSPCEPFLQIQALLLERGVRVPRLLAENRAQGWLLVEDLGDQTLAEALLSQPHNKTALYEQAVRDLARAHAQLATLPETCLARQRCFDAELLWWEIDHFREYGLVARGIALTAEQTARFESAARALAAQIRALPYGFVHRDYQSRNLMVLPRRGADGSAVDGSGPTHTDGNALAWVDFQDAMQGPRVYDLVALLGDSYQHFEPEFVRARIAQYVAERGLPAAELAQVQREFYLVTVQRKLKDAGRFVFIDQVKGDSSFLKFIEPSIAKFRHAMAELPGEPHVQALARLLDELGV